MSSLLLEKIARARRVLNPTGQEHRAAGRVIVLELISAAFERLGLSFPVPSAADMVTCGGIDHSIPRRSGTYQARSKRDQWEYYRGDRVHLACQPLSGRDPGRRQSAARQAW